MSRHSDSSFQRQGRPDGCHRPPLAGLIAQHGGRGVLRRQLYADFLVCVVVVLLALYSQLYRLSRQFGECRDNVATFCKLSPYFVQYLQYAIFKDELTTLSRQYACFEPREPPVP